jgi:hypothetical protein
MPGRDALRSSFEVARMFRTNHAVLVGFYALFVLVVFVGPGTPGVVTPSVVVWLYSLAAGVIHTSMLSVFVHRWRVLSPAVVPAPGLAEDEPEPSVRA